MKIIKKLNEEFKREDAHGEYEYNVGDVFIYPKI